MCVYKNYPCDIAKVVVWQAMVTPLLICIRNAAQNIQQADAEEMKLSSTTLKYH